MATSPPEVEAIFRGLVESSQVRNTQKKRRLKNQVVGWRFSVQMMLLFFQLFVTFRRTSRSFFFKVYNPQVATPPKSLEVPELLQRLQYTAIFMAPQAVWL